MKLGIGHHPALRRLKQEDHQFEAILGYRCDPVSKRKKNVFPSCCGIILGGRPPRNRPCFPKIAALSFLFLHSNETQRALLARPASDLLKFIPPFIFALFIL